MLNENGGIEADLTVTRTAENDFYLVVGAGFTQYLLDRQESNLFIPHSINII